MNDIDTRVGAAIEYASKPAPRVTEHEIEACIVGEYYFTGRQAVEFNTAGVRDVDKQTLGKLTFCVLVIANGFTVTGESACVSLENFDAEYGRKLAREKAVEKLWPLLGFALADRISMKRSES